MQLASTKKLFSFGHWSERSLRMYCHSGVFSTSLTDHWFDSRSSIEMLNRKSREIENVFVPKQLSCLLDNWIMILFVKNGPFPAFFLYFRLFNTVDSKQMLDKACWWLDSNCRSLVSEATALPTEPQPLPIIKANFSNNRSRKNSVLKIFFNCVFWSYNFKNILIVGYPLCPQQLKTTEEGH